MSSSKHIKTQKIQGIEVEYLQIGKGRPLFFLHGAPASFRFYKRIIEKLATKYLVYAPVLPGMGKSQSLGRKTSFDAYCNIIEEFIRSKNVRGAFMGHSFGGGVLAKVVSNNPDLATCLLLVNSIGIPFDKFAQSIARDWFWHCTKDRLESNPEGKVAKLVPQDLANMILKRPHELLRILRILNKVALTDDFRKIKVPTLLLWGKADPLISLEVGQRIQRLIPNSKIVIIPKGAHNWLEYTPEVCFKHVDEFLTSQLD